MKFWTLLGILAVLISIVPLVLWTHRGASTTPAVAWMIGFSGELDGFAQRHEGRYPETYGDLILDGDAPHAANPADPWRRAYVYERHPEDARMCRVYTLGDPRKEGRPFNDTTVVLYRIGHSTIWRQRLDDLPNAWRAAGAPPLPVFEFPGGAARDTSD